MKPIWFKESNRKLNRPSGMTEEECGDLTVFTNGEQCISCWRPTLKERLSILLFGRIWLRVYFGHTQPPVAIEACRTIFKRKY